jgi:hypothetical protein
MTHTQVDNWREAVGIAYLLSNEGVAVHESIFLDGADCLCWDGAIVYPKEARLINHSTFLFPEQWMEEVLKSIPPPTENSFEHFWATYQKKVGRKKCEAKWGRLSKKDKADCMKALPRYVDATPDKQYRMNPETYLNGRRWEDEIVSSTQSAFDLLR